jgi:hypothetical protein
MNLLVYAHGYEESFSLGHWNRLLRQVGCRIVDNSAILFMPGMLRTLDVYLFCKIPSATGLTPLPIAPFACLHHRFRWIRRHGYLIARSSISHDASSTTAAAQTPAIFYYPAPALSSLPMRKRLRDLKKEEFDGDQSVQVRFCRMRRFSQ